MELFEEVVKDVESFPKTEVTKIIAYRVLRGVSSVKANIAEGYGRRKGKEFEHYLYISSGSAEEYFKTKLLLLTFMGKKKYWILTTSKNYV